MDDTDFDNWNGLKKKIDRINCPSESFPQESEVWICILGKNIGQEQNGKGGKFSRPVLILKKFSNHLFWIVPLSSKQKDLIYYHNFTDPFGCAVTAILSQIRLVSIKRMGRKAYIMPREISEQIKEKIRSLV